MSRFLYYLCTDVKNALCIVVCSSCRVCDHARRAVPTRTRRKIALPLLYFFVQASRTILSRSASAEIIKRAWTTVLGGGQLKSYFFHSPAFERRKIEAIESLHAAWWAFLFDTQRQLWQNKIETNSETLILS